MKHIGHSLPMFSIAGPSKSLCMGCLFKSREFRNHDGRDSACRASRFRLSCHKNSDCWKRMDSDKFFPAKFETKYSDDATFSLLHVQTLRNYPREKLSGEVVAVRLDSSLILNKFSVKDGSTCKSLYTIKYLHDAGAAVLLLSSWDSLNGSDLSVDYFADHISTLLQLRVQRATSFCDIMQLETEEQRHWDILLFDNLAKFKEDTANCLDFSKKLSTGIGGKKLLEKRTALRILATKCDGLLFIGNLSFQIMHALGMPVPMNLVENDVVDEAFDLIHFAKRKNTDIIIPDDFLCVDDKNPEVMDVFPCDGIQPGILLSGHFYARSFSPSYGKKQLTLVNKSLRE